MDQETPPTDTIDNWSQLKFWNSGECQVTEERLDDYDRNNVHYNPARSSLFRALDLSPLAETKVCILGQDPYPDAKFATGVAFSIPASLRKFPPTLEMIYGELWDDLKIKRKSGSLEPWCAQGILLWNSIPTCLRGKSMSHDWTEWSYLTAEVLKVLSSRGGIVFALLGSVARRYASLVNGDNNEVIETGHPSPRGNASARNPFVGSRLFSTINDRLVSMGSEPIDWSL